MGENSDDRDWLLAFAQLIKRLGKELVEYHERHASQLDEKEAVETELALWIKEWYAVAKAKNHILDFPEAEAGVLSKINEKRLIEEDFVLGVLALVRMMSNYWQDIALKSSYKIRVYVFEKVLNRDLRFFEGGNGVSSGNIAYRITVKLMML
ncbi:hypothetical protein FRX31_020705 [Thalictrum thalictroides]|uniref:Uncharacterized protein n=1 Tax=Thalictrum thalictroides TaxID=46969 RepID=A0A7J6VXY6_THATH|nr:hypothetical protein FRX31_020705 [Thalictrum thalictroides]